MSKIFIILLLCSSSLPLSADEIRIAAASNFNHALREIAARFEEQSGHRVSLIFASTGKLYAQIINAAPFDIFLAADSRRPELLEQQGLAVAGSRFTYAIGRLVLWSPQPGLLDDPVMTLREGNFSRLAIAHPRLAPYGDAALQLLQTLGLEHDLKPKLVRGENVNQVYQFVKTGNAQLGFVAYAQLQRPAASIAGSAWLVPQSLYSPIRQQAVLLRDNPASREFLEFLRGQQVVNMLTDLGYDNEHAD